MDELVHLSALGPNLGLYTLRGHEPVPCDDVIAWGEWLANSDGDRRVAETTIYDMYVSTVFLGIDHAFMRGPARLFETMIFGGAHDEGSWRCSTWAEAEAQHEMACNIARARVVANG